MRKRLRWSSTFTVAALATCVPLVAAAQDRIPAATGSSDRIAFQPQGLPSGGFRIYPTLRLSTDYDDNISRSNDRKRGDGSVVVAPTVASRSNWSSHQLNADLFYRNTRYFERTEQNHDEYGTNIDGRLDVMRTTKLYGTGSYARLAEQRGGPGDLFLSNNLIQYDTYDVSAQASHQFNRIGITAGVGQTGFQYDDVSIDGTNVDQGFRNRDISTLNGRVEYQYSAVTSPFISGSYNKTNYGRARLGFDRSSTGFSALLGLRFELSRLLRGQVGVGYIRQRFADPSFSDFSGLNYDLSLTYQPTALTSISLLADRRLTDSALFQVVGVLTHNVRLNVSHELLRNVYVEGNAGYSHYTYRGIDRSDNRYDLGLGARYKMNRLLSVALSGNRVTQDSGDILLRRYTSNRATLSFILAR